MRLAWILFFSIAGTVGSLAMAGTFLFLSEAVRNRLVPRLLSYAAGALMATAFLGLLPEALETVEALPILATLLGGFILFFLMEKIVIWHHCHNGACDTHHAAGPLVIVGDGLHNFIDGLVMAAAFLVSIPLGIATAIAVIAHEIPHEVGDFAILIDSGYSRRRAIAANLLSGLTIIPGAVIGYTALQLAAPFIPYVLALAAASFVYIAAVDLVPRLHQRLQIIEGLEQLALLLIGIGTIWLIKLQTHH